LRFGQRNLRQRKDTPGRWRDHQVVTSELVLNMLVSDVLTAAPAAAGVFVGQRMGCVGCAFARFETVGEVADVYGLDPQYLASLLAEVLCSVTRR
jgi:hybrid cluster-associated redox disulfide protein